MRSNWTGIFPAVTTLFHADGTLDLKATASHIDRLIGHGAGGVIVLGTLGENCSLDREEKLQVLETAIDAVKGRVPVLSGVAECTTAMACRLAAEAQKRRCNGLMVLPAMVYKSDARETMSHFRAVAKASDLPIMIYNNPVSYHVDVTPEMFAELADEPRFVAIKESSENVRRITDLVNTIGDRYVLFCGVDDLVLESVLLGAAGWVAGLVNAFPRESQSLWNLAISGRWEEARTLYRWFAPLLHLDTHVKLVQCIKLAMAERGFSSELTRPPRLPLVGQERERVLAIVRQAMATLPG